MRVLVLVLVTDVTRFSVSDGDFFSKIPYFKREEFACECGCGFDAVDVELLFVLIDLREHFDSPVRLTGPNRCSAHNFAVGGSSRSQHIYAKAADVTVDGIHADVVADYLEDKYPDKYGVGRYVGRTHVDVRTAKARWDYRNK